jgi:hypothetical protein
MLVNVRFSPFSAAKPPFRFRPGEDPSKMVEVRLSESSGRANHQLEATRFTHSRPAAAIQAGGAIQYVVSKIPTVFP